MSLAMLLADTVHNVPYLVAIDCRVPPPALLASHSIQAARYVHAFVLYYLCMCIVCACVYMVTAATCAACFALHLGRS